MKYLRTIIALLITIAILIFLFSKIDINHLKEIFNSSNKWLLILTSAILILSMLLPAARWKTILGLLGLKIKYFDALKIYLANYPLAKITPANSGDAVRAFYLRDKLTASKQLGGVVAERLLDIALLALLSIIGSFVIGLYPIAYINLAIILAIIAFFLFAPKIKMRLNGKWNDRMENFFSFFKILRQNPKTFLYLILNTLFIWFTVLVHIKLSFLAFGTNVSFLSIISIQPVVIFIGLLPITLAGLGTREPAMILLFSKFAPAVTSLAVGLVYSFVGQILISIICLPFSYLAWHKTLNIKIRT